MTSKLQLLEKNIAQSKLNITCGEAINRLKANKDFKLIVMDGFFAKEAIRLVHLKSLPSQQTEEAQLYILQQIDAIGIFNQYLNEITRKAELATKSLESEEEAREEMIANDEGDQ